MPNTLNPWPYSYIQKRTELATIEARQQGLRPALAKEVTKNWRQSKRFNIPFLGDYVPDGWEEVSGSSVYVSTIVGAVDSTMTQLEFFKRAQGYADESEVYGFGVIEQAQIKVLIATYRRKET